MLTSFCPVICTSRLGESRDFYTRLFGFKATYETEWYVGLSRPGLPPHELALLDHSHPAAPEAHRSPVRAVRITLEVDDGEEEWERIVTCGAPNAQPALRATDPDGKHLVVTDPNGVRIDVVTPKRPTGDRTDCWSRGEGAPCPEESILRWRSR
ncbi:VOC family protein [Streptomyces sp. KR80]|uniref:VOC family protein n=1 Tax=Streptomyces sp. KR80 TaxID=3457426 RepID=UPI003FD3366D